MSERPQGAPGDAAGDETRPIMDYAAPGPPVPPAATAGGPPAAAAPVAGRQRLRDRLWSLRALIAVALASVIVGGLAGAALATVSNHDGGRDRFGPGFGRHGGFGPGQRRGFGPGNGFVPPGQQGRLPGQQGQQGRLPGQQGQPPGQVPASPTPSS